MALMRVTLGDLVLHDLDVPAQQTGWSIEKMVGWYALPPSKTQMEERPQGHGAFRPGPDWRQSAAISMEGSYEAEWDDFADVVGARNSLNRLGGVGTLVPLTVTDDFGSTTRLVSIRKVDPDDDHGLSQFTFSIDCLAPDPRRYGPVQQLTLPRTLESNLVTNPSFEASTAGWSARVGTSNVALTQGFASAFVGTRHGLLTIPQAASSVVVTSSIPVATSASASRAHLRVRPSVTRPLRLTANVLNSSGGLVAVHTPLDPTVCPAGVWTKLEIELPAPVAGPATILLAVDSTAGTPWSAGETLGLDAVLVGYSSDYADGSTFGWSWKGTPNASISQSKGYLQLVNTGTADVEPSFELAGAVSEWFTLTEMETGRSLRFAGAIPSGSTTTIDPSVGAIKVNGSFVYGLYRYEWPLVPAGETRHYLLLTDSPTGAVLSADFAPAWW